jgi:hypothetical protein
MDPVQRLAWQLQWRSRLQVFIAWSSCSDRTCRHRGATLSPACWPEPSISLSCLPQRRSSPRYGPLASFSVMARSPMFDPTVPGLLASSGKGVACAVI